MALNELNQILAFAGLAVLLIGLFASVFSRTFVAGPLIAMLAGVLLGPVSGVVTPDTWAHHDVLLEQVARFTLAFGLVEIALRLPRGAMAALKRPLALLLGGVMPLAWAVTALLGWWILGLPFWTAALVGAILAPTDPVIASAIVTGHVAEERVPEDARHSLSAESALNDGLALPFVLLSIVVIRDGVSAVPYEWLVRVVLWEVGAAVAMGAALGYLAGRAWQWAASSERMDPPTILMYSLALALVILGAARLIGSDDILAVFAGGLVFDRQVRGVGDSKKRVQEAVTRFFTTPVFIVLGATLPFGAWAAMGWKAAAFVAAVLLLRRLPATFALAPAMPRIRTLPQILFVGWFGPMGVASIYYTFMATRRLGLQGLWPLTSLVIAASVAAHGVTASWAAHRFPLPGDDA